MKKEVQNIAFIFSDSYGIACCDCPKCDGFIPNVLPGPVKCPICNFEFRAEEKK